MQNQTVRNIDDLDETPAPKHAIALAQLERLDKVYDLPGIDRRKIERMREEAEFEARVPMLLRMLQRLDAEEAAEREAERAALIVESAAHPEADDDHFVIADGGRVPWTLYLDPRTGSDDERRHLALHTPGMLSCHWLPRETAEEAIAQTPHKRLPFTFCWDHTPSDLLRELRGHFIDHRQANERTLIAQHSSGRVTEAVGTAEPDYRALLQFAAEAVAGCFDRNILRAWLESAQSGDGEHYQAFAAKLTARLQELGPDGDEIVEDEEDLDDDEEAELEEGDEEELAEEAGEVDATEESPGESPAVPTGEAV